MPIKDRTTDNRYALKRRMDIASRAIEAVTLTDNEFLYDNADNQIERVRQMILTDNSPPPGSVIVMDGDSVPLYHNNGGTDVVGVGRASIRDDMLTVTTPSFTRLVANNQYLSIPFIAPNGSSYPTEVRIEVPVRGSQPAIAMPAGSFMWSGVAEGNRIDVTSFNGNVNYKGTARVSGYRVNSLEMDANVGLVINGSTISTTDDRRFKITVEGGTITNIQAVP